MKPKDISEAKDPDLRTSLAALRRAAHLARETAIRTGTSLIVFKDGKLIRISAQTLRGAATASEGKS